MCSQTGCHRYPTQQQKTRRHRQRMINENNNSKVTEPPTTTKNAIKLQRNNENKHQNKKNKHKPTHLSLSISAALTYSPALSMRSSRRPSSSMNWCKSASEISSASTHPICSTNCCRTSDTSTSSHTQSKETVTRWRKKHWPFWPMQKQVMVGIEHRSTQ